MNPTEAMEAMGRIIHSIPLLVFTNNNCDEFWTNSISYYFFCCLHLKCEHTKHNKKSMKWSFFRWSVVELCKLCHRHTHALTRVKKAMMVLIDDEWDFWFILKDDSWNYLHIKEPHCFTPMYGNASICIAHASRLCASTLFSLVHIIYSLNVVTCMMYIQIDKNHFANKKNPKNNRKRKDFISYIYLIKVNEKDH